MYCVNWRLYYKRELFLCTALTSQTGWILASSFEFFVTQRNAYSLSGANWLQKYICFNTSHLEIQPPSIILLQPHSTDLKYQQILREVFCHNYSISHLHWAHYCTANTVCEDYLLCKKCHYPHINKQEKQNYSNTDFTNSAWSKVYMIWKILSLKHKRSFVI